MVSIGTQTETRSSLSSLPVSNSVVGGGGGGGNVQDGRPCVEVQPGRGQAHAARWLGAWLVVTALFAAVPSPPEKFR